MIFVARDKRLPPLTNKGEPGRRVEWLGESSPMDDPFLWTGIAIHRFTPDMVATIRRAALKRVVRTVDTVRFLGFQYEDGFSGGAVIGCDPPGLTRQLVWCRMNRWIEVLSHDEVDIVLGCARGHEFRDLDATDEDDPGIILPPREVQPGSHVMLKEISREVMRVNGSTEMVR